MVVINISAVISAVINIDAVIKVDACLSYQHLSSYHHLSSYRIDIVINVGAVINVDVIINVDVVINVDVDNSPTLLLTVDIIPLLSIAKVVEVLSGYPLSKGIMSYDQTQCLILHPLMGTLGLPAHYPHLEITSK